MEGGEGTDGTKDDLQLGVAVEGTLQGARVAPGAAPILFTHTVHLWPTALSPYHPHSAPRSSRAPTPTLQVFCREEAGALVV